jgi:hypothetical protein
VTTPEEKVSTPAPSTFDAPNARVTRVARAVRALVDALSLALFVYCQFSGLDAWFGIVMFWLVSLGPFPYASMAERLRTNRSSDWGFLVFGVLIVGIGLIRDVAPVRTVFHGTPTNDSMLLGVVLALCGLTNLLYASKPQSIGRLLMGTATLVAAAIWAWFTIEPAAPASLIDVAPSAAPR